MNTEHVYKVLSDAINDLDTFDAKDEFAIQLLAYIAGMNDFVRKLIMEVESDEL